MAQARARVLASYLLVTIAVLCVGSALAKDDDVEKGNNKVKPIVVHCVKNGTGPVPCTPRSFHCSDECPTTCTPDCNKCAPVCPASSTPTPTPSASPPPPPPTQASPSPPPPPHAYPPPPSTPSGTLSPPPPTNPTSSPSPPPPTTPTLSPPPPPMTPIPSPSPPPPATPTPSPPPPSSSPATAECGIKSYGACYGQKLKCPSSCPDHCEVDCTTCSPVCSCDRPGAVCQDPKFVGADGLTFYFHGQKDRDFCIVSDTNLHINAHFIGRRNVNMRRDFTWVQSIGILFGRHQLFLGAMKTATWDDALDRISLAFDNQPVYLPEREGSTWLAETSSGQRMIVTRSRTTNSVTVEVENNFKIMATVVPITEKDSRIHNYGITQDDCFAHLDLSFKFYSLTGKVNGVLGQTYASSYVSRVNVGTSMPVLGGNREFASSGLFSTDCKVARFNSGDGQLPNGGFLALGNQLDCSSDLNGPGVVCKR